MCFARVRWTGPNVSQLMLGCQVNKCEVRVCIWTDIICAVTRVCHRGPKPKKGSPSLKVFVVLVGAMRTRSKKSFKQRVDGEKDEDMLYSCISL